MDDGDGLAQRFEDHRAYLEAVAYRMLGSRSDADDAVQEAWLRLARSSADEVRNLRGWLTTVVGRICLDMLRSRAARHEEPLDVRVPDPVVVFDGDDPDAVAAARTRWQDAKTAGFAATYWQPDEQGRWQRKA